MFVAVPDVGCPLLMEFDAAFSRLCGRLSSFYPFSLGFRATLGPMLSLVRVRRGTVLLSAGQRQSKVWFLLKGHAREVDHSGKGGGGRTSWFWFADDFLFAYPGFFSQEPAVADMVMVEDSLLLEISYGDFMALVAGFAEVPFLVEKIRDHYERLRVAHAADLVSLSARERYQRFFERHAALFGIAKQKDIASFLGIRDDGFHRYYTLICL